jgi:hypothetical protein
MNDWWAALTVGAEEGGRLLRPRIQLEGRRPFVGGTLRVELVDELGEVRRVARRPIVARSLGQELAMPFVTVPHGVSAADVLRWPWNIVVESGGSELVRWTRYLERSFSVNAEAELELAGSSDPLRSKQESEGKGREAPWDQRDSDRLLATLAARGILTQAERYAALATQAVTGTSVERVLIDSGRVDERSLWRIYSDLTGTEFVDLTDHPIDPQAAREIPEHVARDYGFMAIGYRDELLTVAMSDPQHEPAMRAAEQASLRRIYVVVATRDDILTALGSLMNGAPPRVWDER